jgi:hypothetical protein
MLPDFRVRQRDYLLEIGRAITLELNLDNLLTGSWISQQKCWVKLSNCFTEEERDGPWLSHGILLLS